MRVVN